MDHQLLRSPDIAHCPICAAELDRRSVCFLLSVACCAECLGTLPDDFLKRRLSFYRAGGSAAERTHRQGLWYWTPMYTPIRDGLPSWLCDLTPAQRDTVLVTPPDRDGPFGYDDAACNPPSDPNAPAVPQLDHGRPSST